MSTRILHDARTDRACFWRSEDDWCFGPVFNGSKPFINAEEEAEAFLAWLAPVDPFDLDEGTMEEAVVKFRAAVREGRATAFNPTP